METIQYLDKRPVDIRKIAREIILNQTLEQRFYINQQTGQSVFKRENKPKFPVYLVDTEEKCTICQQTNYFESRQNVKGLRINRAFCACTCIVAVKD
jgi:hypothetical protein